MKLERGNGVTPAPRSCCSLAATALLTQIQLFNDCAVTVDIGLLKVTEEVTSVADHLQHAATAVVILVVSLEVLGQSVDAMSKDRNLNLGRTGVTLVGSILLNNSLLFVLQQHDLFTFLFYYGINTVVGR